jgi:hypothetical protein
MFYRLIPLVFLTFLSGCYTSKMSSDPQLEADVVVYGDAAVGVAAAVQAARMDKSVILVSQYGHLGGMTSSGLGFSDIGNPAILGGISHEFYHRIYMYYADEAAWDKQPRDTFRGGALGAKAFNSETQLGAVFEPKVAEMIFDQMVEEAGVQVVYGRLDLDNGATMDGQRIAQMHLEDGRKISGKMFIDASYEGDLMAAADVSFTVGRESNEQYEETVNGITRPGKLNNITVDVDPYMIAGDPSSGLLPGVNPFDPADIGKGDHRLQAYCYRVCLTNEPDNLVEITKPEDYNEATYEILFRALEAGYRGQRYRGGVDALFKFSRIPNYKTDSNNHGGVSMNKIGNNYSDLPPDHPDYWDWTTLSHEGRARVEADQRSWQQGLIWTLQNHPRVPEDVRQQYAGWGLPKDEFVDNDHWPYNIYVREGRRMISDFVMTENQILQKEGYPQVEDSVGMGSYTMDSHHVQRVAYQGNVRNEGDMQKHFGARPYPIAYKSIIPAKGECENILVPWCVSSSHIAFGSIRMEPVGMILGQSAATAAVYAIEDGVPVQEVDYTKLKKRLIQDDQRLTLGN